MTNSTENIGQNVQQVNSRMDRYIDALSYSNNHIVRGKHDVNTNWCDPQISIYSLQEKVLKGPYIRQAASLKTSLIYKEGLKIIPVNEKDIEKQDIIDEITNEIMSRENEELISIEQSIEQSIYDTNIYGSCLLTVKNDENPEKVIFKVNAPNSWHIVSGKKTKEDMGVRKTLGYFVQDSASLRDLSIDDVIQQHIVNHSVEYGTQVFRDDENNRFLTTDEGFHFRLNLMNPYGLSPLMSNYYLLQMWMDAVWENIETVNNDSVGKVMMFTKEDPSAGALGMDELAWQSDKTKVSEVLLQRLIELKKGFVKNMKGRNNKVGVVALNGGLIEKMEKLEKSFKATDYLSFINSMGPLIAANYFGLQPALLGASEQTYAANMGPALDFTIEHSIKPAQRLFERQITKLWKNCFAQLYPFPVKAEFGRIDTTNRQIEAEISVKNAEFADKMIKGSMASPRDMENYLKTKVSGLKIEDNPDSELDERFISTSVDVLNLDVVTT